jgi:transcriptional regulator with XRE-family HTH domain
MNVTMERISEKIKRLREEKGITKYRLAKLSGLRESYVGQLESGIVDHPRHDTIAALAKGLGVEPSVFFGGDEKKPMPDLIREINERYQALEIIELPILGTIPGRDLLPIENADGNVTILKESVYNVADMSALYVLKINDDSLKEEGILAGDNVVVNKADKEVKEGRIYIVRTAGGICAVRSKDLPAGGAEILGRVVLAGRWRQF